MIQYYILKKKTNPLNIGTIRQHVSGPVLVNCPTHNSKNTSGIPTKSKNIVYGIKKTPPPFYK